MFLLKIMMNVIIYLCKKTVQSLKVIKRKILKQQLTKSSLRISSIRD